MFICFPLFSLSPFHKVYLLDTPFETFVWCGKASDMNLRKEAVEGAQEMVKKAIEEGLKPKWVEVERVAEKGEGALFEDKFFKVWKGESKTIIFLTNDKQWSDSMRAVIGKVSHKTLSNVAISDSVKRQELPRILEMHDGELESEQECARKKGVIVCLIFLCNQGTLTKLMLFLKYFW